MITLSNDTELNDDWMKFLPGYKDEIPLHNMLLDMDAGEIYTFLKQLPIDDESKRRLIEVRTELFYNLVEDLAEQVYSGDISIGQWEEEMKQAIRELHTSTAAVGAGGWDEMTFQQWGRLGTPLREQYRYLHGFAETIQEKRDSISLAQIKARARLYGKAGGYSASLIQAGGTIESLLPYIPRDGSTECLNGCHCRWELSVAEERDDGTRVVHAIWLMSPAEHCDDCIARHGNVETIEVPPGVKIPAVIGGF